MMDELHPLVGVSPLYACGVAALLKQYFAQCLRHQIWPAPPDTDHKPHVKISPEQAARLKAALDEAFNGTCGVVLWPDDDPPPDPDDGERLPKAA